MPYKMICNSDSSILEKHINKTEKEGFEVTNFAQSNSCFVLPQTKKDKKSENYQARCEGTFCAILYKK